MANHCDYHTSLLCILVTKLSYCDYYCCRNCQLEIPSHSKSGNMLQSQDLLKLSCCYQRHLFTSIFQNCPYIGSTHLSLWLRECPWGLSRYMVKVKVKEPHSQTQWKTPYFLKPLDSFFALSKEFLVSQLHLVEVSLKLAGKRKHRILAQGSLTVGSQCA